MDRQAQHARVWRGTGTLLAALLLVGCSSATPTGTLPPASTGSSQVPAASATLSPGQTALPTATGTPSENPTPAPTNTPTDTPEPTTPPTTEPTESPTPEVTPAPTLKHPDWPAGAIGTNAAKNREGQTETVCGKVVGAQWVFDSKGHPTFLNMDKAYPNLRFNFVVWGVDRRDWSLAKKPEISLMGKTVCARGVITSFEDHFQIQNVQKSDIIVVPG